MTPRELTESIRARLKRHRGHYREVADFDGLTYGWVYKFANGALQNPTIDKLTLLTSALDRLEMDDAA